MRGEDRELLERRVGEGIVSRYRDEHPPDEGDPALIKKLLADAGLPTPSDYDIEWLQNHPGITLKGTIERAEADQLTGAYRHLYGVEWVECPEPWLPGYVRAFASHVSADKVLVSEVQAELRTYGIDLFVAHVDIDPTAEWQAVIEQSLNTCHLLVAFLTPGFHNSLWTDQEVGFAYGRGVLVLSLMMGLSPYGFLYKTQGLSVAGQTPEQIAERILETLLRRREFKELMASGLLSALEASESYKDANTRIKTLQRLPRWPRLLVDPLRAADAFNSQVDGAYNVSYGVTDMLKRVED